MKVGLKRAYDPPAKADGCRVLVDRLWPRGISKEAACLAAWLPALAPSNELRRWYHAHPAQWILFRKRYMAELRSEAALAALDELHEICRGHAKITLVYASKNETHNNAVVLKQLLEGAKKPPTSSGPARAAAGRMRARARR